MTMNLIDSSSMSTASPNKDALEFKSEAASSFEGQSFGQYLSEMFQPQADKPQAHGTELAAFMPAPVGQEVADPSSLGQPDALNLPVLPLRAVTLGPHLNIITPSSSAPDTQSLEAFARAQGLDDKAVKWLFGAQADHQETSVQANAVGLTASSQSTIPGSLTQGASGMPGVTSAGAILMPAALAEIPANVSATGLLTNNPIAGAQAFWAVSKDSGANTKNSATPSTEEAPPIQMLRMPPPAAVWMQRSAMNSVLSGNNTTTPKAAAISLSELDLGADWGGDALQQLSGAEGGTTASSSTGTHGTAYANFASRWDAQAASRGDIGNANLPGAELPDAAARSENIQNLADKMGQAVGQRILSEMERGQWHLKLQLRPATLGHIEVEMRMRNGEFDAVFTAPNALTRDLLQDGMAKLRETLSQMGMDVANIHVGGGQTGQNGGDPTPGSSGSKSAPVEANAQESTAEISKVPRVKDPSDGLDVLV